jgi:NAD(P)-dependent dehydrogenase (short-subunit alcohol dehydrogenase family)
MIAIDTPVRFLAFSLASKGPSTHGTEGQAHCTSLVGRAVKELGGLDILVNNAAHQCSFESIEDISAEEWDLTFRTNIYSMFYLCRAAMRHLKPGSSIINTSSINATSPSPHLLAYATTKGAIANFTAGLGQLIAERGIRVNAVAPGPIWTPLIPSTMPPEAVEIRREYPARPARPAGRTRGRVRANRLR